jgi:hypothetical protein
MASGFTFDFDSDASCLAQPTLPVAQLQEPIQLHPFHATLLSQLINENSAKTHGQIFESICVDSIEDIATGSTSHFLKHITGVRLPELQHGGIQYDVEGAEGDEAADPTLRDIVPGQYLGGLKVWSCAVDLAKAVFAAGRPAVPSVAPSFATPLMTLYVAIRNAMQGDAAKILELGCGHGLPGMAALACGANDVSFHDFNHEVLEHCLLPGICATFGSSLKRVAIARGGNSVTFSNTAVVRAGSGEWQGFAPADPDTAEPMLFDCILGADVTYDEQATAAVVATIARLLKPGGTAFIGTKVYYFGTGGGREAIAAAVACFPNLAITLDVATQTEGDAMHRSILAISAHV